MSQLHWLAQYNDGNQATSEDTGYSEIDRSRLQCFYLLKDDNRQVVSIIFDDDGEKLVWTRRIFKLNTGEEQVFHIVGKKGQFILAVTPDDEVIARHNFKDDGLFDEVIQ